MKIQLSPTTIRLRLSEAEVQQFDQAGQLAHSLALGPGPAHTLSFALLRLPGADAATGPTARFEGGELRVELPETEARAWAGSGAVGMKGAVEGTDGQQIRIIVEKDLGPSH